MFSYYRVWPDGTVQKSHEKPYSWKSDDFTYVDADSEEEAIRIALGEYVKDEDRLVSITEKEYLSLLEDSRMLSILKAHGVDNWNGYAEAYKEFLHGKDF